MGPAGQGLPEYGAKMPYIVQRGDTLAKIATRVYGALGRWKEIQELTQLPNPNRIYPGDVVYYHLSQESVVFAKTTETAPRQEVTVQKGDTLATVASRVFGHAADWKILWRHNDVNDPDHLQVGTTLYYPSGGNAHASAAEKGSSSMVATWGLGLPNLVAATPVASLFRPALL